MNFFDTMNISTTGLTVNRLQMNVVASNLSNSYTTRTETGQPYRRKVVVLESKKFEDFDTVLDTKIQEKDKDQFYGVKVGEVAPDMTPFRKVYQPGHPHADKEGFVSMPNINVMVELANIVIAKRSYDANVTALGTTKSMAMKALEVGK